ncbi:dihydrodipicolinate synthase family protein [Alkalicoccus daliensis]|uniref:4-hydroxy-tetrahydrodipicolinate synthase n=1 Tax=Alkalicoccus daliensis TaxID=745820 RepID=A0A1H0D7F8_9BACI|nr:dihydrodipicolinate synthase family protein [Alkalicoccus daliensis]SDN65946.1 4-hydroxy-tetrahydrodipicolinate synthase [Alkalicoccus daliensis]
MLNEKVHIAVPTAFFEDESLNIAGTIAHIRDLYQQGMRSVLVSGSTGEQHSLSLQEKIELANGLEREVELIRNMEIIFGVAAVRQKEAEQLAEKIRKSHISGIMLGFPPYVKPTQEEAVIYAESIIKLCEKPVILYNNPGRTGFDLSAESIIQLSKLDAVIGIKDAGSKEKIAEIKSALQKDLYFYAGGEEELEEKTGYGYDRLSSITGNIAPEEISCWFHQLVEKQEISSEVKERIAQLRKEVYEGNAVLNVKHHLNQKSIPVGICRSPIGNSYDG